MSDPTSPSPAHHYLVNAALAQLNRANATVNVPEDARAAVISARKILCQIVCPLGTDWQGHPLPADEPPDKLIQVWQVTPHPDGEYDHLVERSWQELNYRLSRTPELYLDRLHGEGGCREGITVTIKLVDMLLDEYRRLTAEG